MANFHTTLIPLLSSIALLLAAANTARSQTMSFTYDFYQHGDIPTRLTYQGDAHFPSDTTYLRLTKTDDSGKPQKYSAGRVVHTTPVQFWESGAQVDLETTIKFIITPVDNDPADGLVFFIAPVGTTIPSGSHGGNFGVFAPSNEANPSVFAVEFDTFVNSNVDPNYRHIGIDIENRKSSNTTKVDDAILGQEVTARIDYEEATKVISVEVTAGSKKYEVSYVYDLSTVLNQQVQVGLAAGTGGSVAIHDVVSWYFTATLVHTTPNAEMKDAKIRQYV